MTFFDNFTIKSRLLVSFSFVLLLLGVVVGSNYRSGQNSVDQVRKLIDEEFKKFELVAAIDSATKDIARRTLNLFVVPTAERAGVKERMGQAKKEIDALFAALEPLLVLPEGKTLFTEMREKACQ